MDRKCDPGLLVAETLGLQKLSLLVESVLPMARFLVGICGQRKERAEYVVSEIEKATLAAARGVETDLMSNDPDLYCVVFLERAIPSRCIVASTSPAFE
jgi:hypothetical protein